MNTYVDKITTQTLKMEKYKTLTVKTPLLNARLIQTIMTTSISSKAHKNDGWKKKDKELKIIV